MIGEVLFLPRTVMHLELAKTDDKNHEHKENYTQWDDNTPLNCIVNYACEFHMTIKKQIIKI
jgi:hypothetical protein